MPRRAEGWLAVALALLLPALARAEGTPGAVAPPPAQDAVPASPAAGQTADAAQAAAPDRTRPAAASGEVTQTKDRLTRLPSAADMRPTGPVTINANRAELVQSNSAVYVGNVTLDSNTLKMDGERLELKRAADGPYTARITGSPAHMSHAGDGPDNPPVSARAKLITYDSRSGIIDLVGDALLTRGDDQTTAETIHYHVLERRYEASGGDNGSGRVTIVIPQATTAASPNPAAAVAEPAAAPAAGGAEQPATPASPPQDGTGP